MDGWIRWMMLSMDGEDSFIHLLFVRVLLGFSVFDEILISFFLSHRCTQVLNLEYTQNFTQNILILKV